VEFVIRLDRVPAARPVPFDTASLSPLYSLATNLARRDDLQYIETCVYSILWLDVWLVSGFTAS